MPHRTGTDLTLSLKRLALSDTPQLFALHRRVRLSSVFGALDPRSPAEFAKLLADSRTAAVGAEIDGRLVGYAISAVPDKPSAPTRYFLARFGVQSESLAESRGIAVAFEHRKRGIGAAMIRFQRSLLNSNGIEHGFNVVLLRNDVGVIARVVSGAVLIGHVADRNDDLCFLAYTGPLRTSFDHAATYPVPLADTREQQRLFGLGYAVLACQRADPPSEAGCTLILSPER